MRSRASTCVSTLESPSASSPPNPSCQALVPNRKNAQGGCDCVSSTDAVSDAKQTADTQMAARRRGNDPRRTTTMSNGQSR